MTTTRDRTASENMGLVHSIAQRFKGRGIEYDDLVGAGCVGLVKAIDRFAGKIVDKITGKVFTTLDKWTEGGIHSNVKEDNFVLGAVKGFLPVTCLRCSLCDFDINYNTYQNGYSVNNDQMETTSIKIKVRQAEEIHNWQILEPYRNLLNNTERQFGQDPA